MSRPRRPEPEKSRAPDRKRKAPHAPVPSHQFLDGEPILDEVRPSVLALALWQRYRDVALWAATPAEHRFGLFGAQGCEPSIPLFTVETAGEPELRPALKVFALLTVHPEATDGETVALMCVKISEWAFARGWLGTGQLFAELAYAARPTDPDYSRIAGRACRRCALYERGVQWFRVSLALSRRAHDAQSAALALIWWGTLEEQRGNIARTKRLYIQAWKTANRGKLRWIVAQVCHDLMGIELGNASFAAVENYAETAFENYRKRDTRYPTFVADVGAAWVSYGFYSAALPVLKAAIPFIQDPFVRILAFSYQARGAAAVNNADLFFASWDKVVELIPVASGGTAVALLNVARGARKLRYEQRALALAEDALRIARIRNEKEVEKVALQVLSAEPQSQEEASHEAPASVLSLSARMLERLRTHTPPE